MTFVTGGLAVAGLAAVAIPIMIFLLWRQRRTPIKWAAMRFLLEAYKKHRRRLQVEQLLLLAVRCLIVALLGAALARPLLEHVGLLDGGGSRTVYLIVDDGVVSGLQDDLEETALSRHVAAATEIIDGLEPGDRVGLITTARPARALLHPPSTDRRAVVDLLDRLEPSGAPSDLPGAIDRLRTTLEQLDADHDQILVYLFSELRAGSATLDDALPTVPTGSGEAGRRVQLLSAPPAAEAVGNVQITAIEPARRLLLAGSTDGSGQITVRLARHGAELDEEVSRVRLIGDGLAHVEPRVVTWSPGQTEASADFVVNFGAPRDSETGIVAALDDDALDADNERATVLALRREIAVVLIDRRSFGLEPTVDRLSAGQWIQRALAPAEGGPIDVITVEPAALDIADLRTTDVAVLPRPDLLAESGWAALRRFTDLGGLLVITPPAERNVHQWTDNLRDVFGLRWQIDREVHDFPAPQPLADEQPPSALLRMISSDLAELCLPVFASRALPVQTQQTEAEIVLRFADGTPLVVAGSPFRETTDDARADGDTTPTDERRSRGLIVYMASAPELEWTNLPGKPLMVPLFQEIVRQGLSLLRAGAESGVGERPPLAVGPAATGLITPDGSRVALDNTGRPERPLDTPGLYRVVDAAAQEIGTVAVNVEVAAARTDPQPASAVQAWLTRSGPWAFFDPGDVAAELRRAEGGSPLAGMLLLVVLGLIIVETVLARWFSHAYRVGAETAGRRLMPTMGGSVARGTGGAA